MYVGGARPEREKPTGCPIMESLWAVCMCVLMPCGLQERDYSLNL